MKALNKTFILFILFTVLCNVFSFANSVGEDTTGVNRDVKKYYLQINSTVNDSKGPEKADEKVVKGAIIKVMNSNNYLVASYFTDKKGKVSFQLALDKKYKVIISKKGYVSKIVEIDAFVPKQINAAFVFPADISIFAEVPKLNTDVLLKPISKIQYNKQRADFDYDVAYTHKINGELKKMYKEYYALKKAAQD